MGDPTTAAGPLTIDAMETVGVMTVIAYRGHAEGEQETAAIEEQIRRQPTGGITVDRINGNDEDDTSPVLFVWRRASNK